MFDQLWHFPELAHKHIFVDINWFDITIGEILAQFSARATLTNHNKSSATTPECLPLKIAVAVVWQSRQTRKFQISRGARFLVDLEVQNRVSLRNEFLGPFPIPQVTWNFSSESLDRFLSSIQVTWKPSHLAKSHVTSVADLEKSGIALTSLFVFCVFLNSYMWHCMVSFTLNERKAVSQNSLHW